MLAKTKRPAEAIAHLRRAFESSPTKETGLALYEALVRARQFGDALGLCAHEALAEVRPSAYAYLQIEAFEGGAFDVSARAGEAAFRLRPDPQVAYNVACAYARDGDGRAALEWLEAALREGFDDGEVLASDSDLDSLRGQPAFERLRARLRQDEPPG